MHLYHYKWKIIVLPNMSGDALHNLLAYLARLAAWWMTRDTTVCCTTDYHNAVWCCNSGGCDVAKPGRQ